MPLKDAADKSKIEQLKEFNTKCDDANKQIANEKDGNKKKELQKGLEKLKADIKPTYEALEKKRSNGFSDNPIENSAINKDVDQAKKHLGLSKTSEPEKDVRWQDEAVKDMKAAVSQYNKDTGGGTFGRGVTVIDNKDGSVTIECPPGCDTKLFEAYMKAQDIELTAISGGGPLQYLGRLGEVALSAVKSAASFITAGIYGGDAGPAIVGDATKKEMHYNVMGEVKEKEKTKEDDTSSYNPSLGRK